MRVFDQYRAWHNNTVSLVQHIINGTVRVISGITFAVVHALVKAQGTCARVTVQRMVSRMKSEQASNVYLFTQVRKAWEDHTVRSTSEYYYILADTCAMISYYLRDRGPLLCGCNELVKSEKKIPVVLLIKADYFAE